MAANHKPWQYQGTYRCTNYIYIPNTVTTASCIVTLANMWYAFICHCNVAMYEIYTLIVYVTVSVKTLHVHIFYTVSQK